MTINNNIFSCNNYKEKPSTTVKSKVIVETKTAQYVHDIELHFTEKEKKDTNKKIKKISIEIKRM